MDTNKIAKALVTKGFEGYVGPDNIWGLALHYLSDTEESYQSIVGNPDYNNGELLFELFDKEWAKLENSEGEVVVSESITSDVPEGMVFVTEEEMLAIVTHGTTLH